VLEPAEQLAMIMAAVAARATVAVRVSLIVTVSPSDAG
jgi:hypothetical protein